MVTVSDIIEYSHKMKLSHIPSSLSMLTYINVLFFNKHIQPYRDRIVLGKPFGSQAYYLAWNKLGYIDNIEALSMGVKHGEIDFVDYGEETMGNALGVATGIAIANPDQMVWVNLTDATLQMGSTLEALLYVGHNNIDNIVVTVDYNNMQVTGKTSEVLDTSPVIDMIKSSGWNYVECDGHSVENIDTTWRESLHVNKPRFFCYMTKKGNGVDYMEADPVKWHYRPIEEL